MASVLVYQGPSNSAPPLVGGKDKAFKCDVCGSQFNRKDNFKRHREKVHQIKEKENVTKSVCIHPGCDRTFYHRLKMLQHLENDHCIHTSRSDHQFKSMEKFLRWKECEEATNYVFFSKAGGTFTTKTTRHMYYVCQRDGSDRAHRAKGTPARLTNKRNKKGRVKTGVVCPARMLVKNYLVNDIVDVIYIRSHSHTISYRDVEHHPVPKMMQQEIKGKLALGITISQIKREMRSNVSAIENKDAAGKQLRAQQFLRSRVVRQLTRNKRKKNKVLHSSDAQSTYLLVKQLDKETYSPVLLYKPLGRNVCIGDGRLSTAGGAEKIFALGLQTKEQLQMLSGHEILFINHMTGTNQYAYDLFNLFVRDDAGKPYSVGHLLCSCGEEDVLKAFFREVKKRCPDLGLKVVMADDDSVVENAVKEVFGEAVQYLLCKTPVIQAWNAQLHRDIPYDPRLVEEMNQCLLLLLEAHDTESFIELCNGFMRNYQNNTKCKQFIQYWLNWYMKRPQVWAVAYRHVSLVNVDIGTLAEPFFKRLNAALAKDRETQRIDLLISTLLDLEEQNHWQKQLDLIAHPVQKTVPDDASAHSYGVNIPDSAVEPDPIETDVWHVKSDPNDDIYHTVKAVTGQCSEDHCFAKCTQPPCNGLCAHLYMCNCDSSGSLCVHMHKIQSYRLSNETAQEESDAACTFVTTDEPIPEPEEPDVPDLLEETKSDIIKLGSMLTNPRVTRSLLPHINATINNLLHHCADVLMSTKHSMEVVDPPDWTSMTYPYPKNDQFHLPPLGMKRREPPTEYLGPPVHKVKVEQEIVRAATGETVFVPVEYSEVDENPQLQQALLLAANSVQGADSNGDGSQGTVLIQSLLSSEGDVVGEQNEQLQAALRTALNSGALVTNQSDDGELRTFVIQTLDTGEGSASFDQNEELQKGLLLALNTAETNTSDGQVTFQNIAVPQTVESWDESSLVEFSEKPNATESATAISGLETLCQVGTALLPVDVEASVKQGEVQQSEQVAFKVGVDDEDSADFRPGLFTPAISSSYSPNESVIFNGPHALTLLNLKSLEPGLPPGEVMALHFLDNQFKEGELYDEIINSYFWVLTQKYPDVAYVPSSSTTALIFDASHKSLLEGVNIKDKRYIFLPWNPSESHWVLWVVDVKKRRFLYLNPSKNLQGQSYPEDLFDAYKKLSEVMCSKLGFPSIAVEFPTKVLQRDSRSGGVMLCFYGQQLCENKPLSQYMSHISFRKKIYETVIGKCRPSPQLSENICHFCTFEIDEESKVQCPRCRKLYHLNCAGLKDGNPDKIPVFYCP